VKVAEYIVIAGGGRIGSKLAELLLEKGKDVAIIEKNKEVCEELASRLNALIIHGDATSRKALEDAGTRRADAFAGVTGDDSHNIVACHMAKHMFQVPLTLARVENPEMIRTAQETGIDFVFSPSHVSAFVLENAISLPGTVSVLLSGTLTRAVEVTLTDNSPADGKAKRLRYRRNLQKGKSHHSTWKYCSSQGGCGSPHRGGICYKKNPKALP
jgi:Trk K+ transport system NAD-binding subunit